MGRLVPEGRHRRADPGMVKLFTDIGGRIELNAEVSRIEVDGRRATGVVLHDGRTFDADIVASNADVVHTYDKLLRGTTRGARRPPS